MSHILSILVFMMQKFTSISSLFNITPLDSLSSSRLGDLGNGILYETVSYITRERPSIQWSNSEIITVMYAPGMMEPMLVLMLQEADSPYASANLRFASGPDAELGITKTRYTKLVAIEDETIDSRPDIRYIFVRWIQQNEINDKVLIPLTQINQLTSGEIYVSGRLYRMSPKQGEILDRVLKIPQWRIFLQEMAQISQMPETTPRDLSPVLA